MIKWLEQFLTITRKSFTVFLGDPFALLLNLFFLGATLFVASLPGFTFGEHIRMLRDQLTALAFSGGCLAAVLGGVCLISEDIRNGMVPVIMSRPVQPSAFIFGRWAGLMGVLAVLTVTAGTACLWATRLIFHEQEIETFGVTIYVSIILLVMILTAIWHYIFKGSFARQANLAASFSFIIVFVLLNFFGYEDGFSEKYGIFVDWESIYFYLYIFLALMVFSSIVCCFSVIFDQSLLMIFAAIIFFGGLFTQFFINMFPSNEIQHALQVIIPNWQTYWIADRLGNTGFQFQNFLSYLFQAAGQSIIYLLIGTILFQRREIKGDSF